jgi:hypothetical protein
MKFVILRKADRHTEAGPAIDETLPVDASLPHAALQPSAQGVRLHFGPDGPRVVPGPFEHTEELVAGFGYLEAESLSAATDRLGRWTPAAEAPPVLEVRESGCPGGLPGIHSPPAGQGTDPRFMVMLMSDAQLEADEPPEPKRLDAMARRNAQSVAGGVLVAGDGLKSTAKGARVAFAAGRPRVVDGPFAEAKELIAGFWVIRAPTMAEAIEWASRYPYAPAHPVVEIRPVRETARQALGA